MVDGKIILTDSTHVKASASSKANIKVLAEYEITDYMERLDRYEAAAAREIVIMTNTMESIIRLMSICIA